MRIGSFHQEERSMREKVLEEKRAEYTQALDKAGIESPFTTYDIHLKTGAETAGGTSQPIEEAN